MLSRRDSTAHSTSQKGNEDVHAEAQITDESR